VRDRCRDLGIEFDPWQDGAGRAILAKREDGTYAATIGGVAISIPRQVGKTFLLGAITFALCLLNPDTKVLWTAHRLRTAAETFLSMQGLAQRKRVAPFIAKVVQANGEEEIRFRNGSRIMFGARESGFGRGMTEVDVLVFDEAQILTERALDDMLPATNQSRQPAGALVFYTGTPPKPTDPGEVFTRMRREALAGESPDSLYLEFSADPDADPDDWGQVRKANPSFPHRTPREAVLRMRKGLSRESYRREGLGVWDEVDVADAVVPAALWRELLTVDPPAPDARPSALGLDRWHDGSTAVAAAWRDGDDTHVELVAAQVTDDVAATVAWVAERAGVRIPVVVATDSPAAALIADLKAHRVRVITASAADYGKACVGFVDDAVAGRLTHAGQDPLDTALAGARKRAIGAAGAWGWDRKDPAHDISPLVAGTLARFGAVLNQPKRPRKGQPSGKVLVL
jgi:hypothetical protein